LVLFNENSSVIFGLVYLLYISFLEMKVDLSSLISSSNS
jgi:hypothetical protein